MNWQDFPAGKRVVCTVDCEAIIDQHFGKGTITIATGSWPKQGEIYTVRAAMVDGRGVLVLELEEHEAPALVWRCSHGHDHPLKGALPAAYFRPLDESRLDQFRVHLQDKPADAPREAVPA